MIDLLAILASCSMLVWMILRAIRLDSRLPWYGAPAVRASDPEISPKSSAVVPPPFPSMMLPPPPVRRR